MAAVTGTVVYEEGTAEKIVLYRVKVVDTNDTLDVSAKFSKLKAAVTVPAGDLATADVTAVAGTTVTLDVAGADDDTLYVLVVGNSAA